jgi:gliding motility-associated-like protein
VYTYISFLLLFFTGNLNAQTVDFSFTTSNNLFCNPQTVTFTQTCTGNPDGFVWNFGNGSVGSAGNETITYNLPGTYTVTLTATFANSAFTITKLVTINPTPTIALTVDRNYICQPGNITFTAPGSAFLTSYEWDFGDGTPVQTTGINTVTHFYATYNSFTANVKGITANGCSATTSINVRVSKFAISAAIAPNQGCIPSNSTLTATPTLPIGDAPLNYTWTFGDATANATTVANNTIHTYNITTPITTASVFITSVQGCTNTFNYTNFAFGTPPFNINAYTAAARDTFCGSETITFNGKATNANNYIWDFGDGTSGNTTDTTISNKYTTLGNKQIIVTSYFNGCAGTKDTIDIYVTGVIAKYTFANTCNAKNTFNYANASIGGITQFRWSFSDVPGFVDNTNFSTSHSFPVSGSFTTKLYVNSTTTGCSDSLTTNQYTATPSFTSNKVKVCKDSSMVYAINNSYPPVSGYSYSYYINGIILNTASTLLNFNPVTHGVFNEYVVITNPAGNTCNDTVPLGNTTTVQGPVVNFSTLAQACQVNTFPLNNTTFPFFATDSITKWEWNFGDNTKDSVRNPLPHKYAGSGGFTISLKATDTNKCAQLYTQTVIVHPMPILKALPSIDTICAGGSTNLFAYTIDTLLWTPNININCTTCDTIIVNPTITTYYVAQAKNSYGCISYDTSLVKVYGPLNLQIIPNDTTVCPQKMVPLKTNTPGITVWSPSTYLSATNIPNPISTPDTSIVYTAIVTDSVGCYSDTATANVRTFSRPTVNAGLDMTLPYNTAFTLNPVYSSNVVTYNWAPFNNNLSCTGCASPNGVALLTTTYSIDVTSTDGCTASDTVSVLVACDEANLYVPTAFTPNRDGKNDYFYPITRGYKIINKILIYDRWGKKVFEGKNLAVNIPTLGWNGFNGVNQATDTQAFVWYIEATCELGETIKQKGTVVLVR